MRAVGFTMVELIIVIIVIAILVTITVVSYSTITRSATEQALQSDLRDAASKLAKYRADNGGYPSSLVQATIENVDGKVFTYVYEPVSDKYCLAVAKEDMGYYLLNTNSEPQQGAVCPSLD